MSKSILIEVGAGELIDKWTILQIKRQNINDSAKLKNINREITALAPAREALMKSYPGLVSLERDLESVNQALWLIEDEIRLCERRKDFGDEFIKLARSVYIQNDQRATVKKTINMMCEADIIEEKSYEEF
jgi:hypothetical protein